MASIPGLHKGLKIPAQVLYNKIVFFLLVPDSQILKRLIADSCNLENVLKIRNQFVLQKSLLSFIFPPAAKWAVLSLNQDIANVVFYFPVLQRKWAVLSLNQDIANVVFHFPF